MKRRVRRIRKPTEPPRIVNKNEFYRQDKCKGCLQDITSTRKKYRMVPYPYYEITLACGHVVNRTPGDFKFKTLNRIDCGECKP